MIKIPITMWMNVPSFYQQDIYRELVGIDGGKDPGLMP
jgi:hypothetical protein